jgi:methionyl-tRNA formyltransferase
MLINNQNIKTVFMGSSEFSIGVLDELKANDLLPDLIVTSPDKPRGRKMIITPNEVKSWGLTNNIPVNTPAKLRDPEFLELIKQYDLQIVASFGRIIPDSVLNAAKFGALNIHPSLLPKYRGPSPLQTTILNNDRDLGVTIMLLDAEVDHGELLGQVKVATDKWPLSFTELYSLTAKEGSKLLISLLPKWINKEIKAIPQDHSQATFTKKVEKTDGEIKLTDDPYKNLLKIKAYSHWPQAYFIADKKGVPIRVKITDADWENNELVIKKVIPEGKNEMDYKAFLNGLK